jgi:hypothetical protein
MRTRGLGFLVGIAWLCGAGGAERSAADITPDRVADLVRRAKPSKPEAWTRIPWTGSLAEARAASRKEGSPVFLFALRGDLAGNRC